MTITIKSNTTIRPNVTVKGFTAPTFKFDAESYTSGAAWLDTSGQHTKTYSYFNTPSDFSFGVIKVVGDGAGQSYVAWSGQVLSWMDSLQIGYAVKCNEYNVATITGAKTTYSGPNTNTSGWDCYPISIDLASGTSNDINIGTIIITSIVAALHGDVTLTTGPKALNFTSTGGAEEGYAQVTPGVYFNRSFTAEGWVYVNSYTTWARLFDFGGGAGDDNVIIAVSNLDSGLPVFACGGQNITSNTQIPLEEWVHLSATYDYASSTGTLYMNGAQVAQAYQPHKLQNNTHNFCYIGKSNWGADSNLEGAVGELAIYPFAMSGTEVLAQYNTRKTHYGL